MADLGHFFPRKDAYHLCTAFVLPIIPPSLSLSYHLRCPYRTTFVTPTLYHLRYALFCQLSITQTLPTFPNFPTFPGFPTFPKRFTLPTLPKCFPTHNSHPPHLPPRLYIAGRSALPFAKFAEFAKFVLKKILTEAHSSPVAHHLPVSPMLRLPSQPPPPSQAILFFI